MWAEKYKPKKLEEVIGNKTAVEAIKNFDWKKPLLLYGGLGVGKTALIEAIAGEINFDIIELDESNMEQASSIAETSSLYGRKKLVVVDNVDKISDIKKVAYLLEVTKNPTILTTTDPKSKRLKTIKTMCFEVQLRRQQSVTIANYLEEICKKEKTKADKDLLLEIADNSKGDIRIALTDLETIAKGRNSITKKDLEVLYSRDVESDIYKTLNVIFSSKDLNEVVGSTWNLDEELRNVIFWIEENAISLIQEVKPLSNAFYFLSRADIFLGRIIRRQYWGFLRYANTLMTAGVNISKEKIKYSMYKFPSYFIRMGASKSDRNMATSISKKLHLKIHASNRTIIKEDIPLLKNLLKKNKVDEETLKNEYLLSNEELAYFKES